MKGAIFTFFFCFAIPQIGSSQAEFSEATQFAGLSQAGLNYGVAVSDFDQDGLDDIFASRIISGGVLYKNSGDGTFSNVTTQAGIIPANTAQFAVWGDVNNDGWPDLFIGARDEPNALYLNNQDGTFTDITTNAGVATGSKVKSALFADVNMDGWLDIYVARLGLQNILYRNNGGGTFTDIAMWSGATDPSISMGAIFFDYDNDGDPDLYLTHDANIPNILYRNNGNGQFMNVSAISGANIASMGMGVDVGDINNDGWLDIYITNLGANALLLNNGNGTFSNIAVSAGVGDFGMGWGCSFLDYDNDGWQDIYVANDSNFSPFPNRLYRNNGNNTFSIVSENSPVNSMEGGYGFGCFDYEQDGKLDIYLANYSGNVGNQLFKNESTNGNHWLKIKTVGVESNTSGIGTRATLEFEGKKIIDEVNGGSGWASQNSLTLHFGLGLADTVDLLIIRWPSGIIDSFENVAANQLLVVTEGESKIEDPDPTAQMEVLPVNFEIEVLPNPVREQFSVFVKNKTGSRQPLTIRLFDASGKFLHTLAEVGHFSGQEIIRADSSTLPPGFYLLKIEVGDEIFTKQVFKQ